MKQNATSNREIAIYCLHFQMPDGRVSHYIGSAFEDRLLDRFKEHARLEGSKYTSRLLKNGSTFEVANIITPSSRREERKIKTAHAQKAQCPICSPSLQTKKHRLVGRCFEAIYRAQTNFLAKWP